jgi:hypothetical protein
MSRCDELGVTWDQVQERHQKMTMLFLRGRLPAVEAENKSLRERV